MFLPIPKHPLRLTCILLPLVALAACSSRKELAKAPPPTEDIIELRVPELDGRGSYRFMMSDGEKKMSADEFDAWMKANGIRVAKGR